MDSVTLTPLAPIASKENFLQRFGDWIEGLFTTAENDFQKLDDEAKKAAVWGSGIIAIINNNLNATPADVISTVEAKFPELHLDILQGFLNRLQQQFDAAAANTLTLEDAVAWAQGWLAKHKATGDSFWGTISSAAANVLSILFSPETPIEKFISLGIYVYHQIVKPHVEAPIPAPVTATLAPEPAAQSSADQSQSVASSAPTMVVGSPEWNAAVDAEVQRRINAVPPQAQA